MPMRIRLAIMADNFSNTNVSGAASFGSQDSSFNTYGRDANFEVSDFFEFSEWIEQDVPAFSSFSAAYNPQLLNYTPDEGVVNSNRSLPEGTINGRDTGSCREQKEIRERVAFKTKSDVEILDDGFKWRKYGKKMVKNSPNPRNYYKCSVEGCPVKKRVERDKEDQRFVVTTYEGIHNHEGPTL